MGRLAATFTGTVALVTGPRGFVGGRLCEALLEAGARVVGLELAGPGRGYFDASGLGARVEIVEGSVADPEAVARAFEGRDFHYVMHLAGQAVVGRALEDPRGAFEANVRGTWLLMDHCRRLWDEGRGPLRGVVTASTERVYGGGHAPPHREDAPLLGLAPYDASKVAADVIARSFAATYGVPAAVARCSNIYGPGDANCSRIVPNTVLSVLRGERPQISSDGSPERDYLYVGDVVEAYLALAARAGEEGVRGEAFNIGSGTPTSVLALVREICVACGKPELEPEVLGAPTAAVDRQYVSVEKAAERLGWTARTPRDEGLRRTVEWYRGTAG